MRPHTHSTGAKGTPGEITTISVLAARLTWAAIGPASLLVTTWLIIDRGTGWLTAIDAFFAVVVGLMLLGRWVEHRSGAATTLTGEPATEGQFRRYMTILPAASGAVWVLANALGNHILE